MTGVTEIYRCVDDKPPARANNSSASGAMSVVIAVEKSLLRTVAFVLYQLDRNSAKYCASSIVQWYMQLQTQLPVAAVDSLDRVADSVVSLSDAQFTDFWQSLVAKELDEASYRRQQNLNHNHPHRHCNAVTSESDDSDMKRQNQTFVKRFYQQLFVRVQRLFTAGSSNQTQTQTPCTSPVDIMDISHRQTQRYTRHRLCDTDSESDCSMSDVERTDDEFEPGWAIEYMEQDSTISSEMFQRMANMMHSSVPANLFRATVTLSGSHDRDVNSYIGAVTPGSFPPTPITRDLQTRRMNHYTISVLDHATLTLRLLTEKN
ncbi:uncharacterized protein PHALS_01422 [Plasmopara halstedii]|uniref:Uncharacterized protein n=1 Tax=Plasmopara halstedii TaxID=4781 RepID=A0A0P1AST2_PLAHL|nr:uncharacterized protein PHALS_01422 [Plasmopara halstedii]CEG45098.1 hypothetical protein PHALS_01422 [Plasmopara halstedii]|eukprot:XP_024581467.1 hypothetical protein PHALS_01422 [Plasmopara halstedii]